MNTLDTEVELRQEINAKTDIRISWGGSCLGLESTLHQIAPYIGKMKSTMASRLIREYSRPGDLVLDPFVGSGIVALECLIAGRQIIASDINPYAVLLTRAKMEAPRTLAQALSKATHYLKMVKISPEEPTIEETPEWVKEFFHPKTLSEILRLNALLMKNNEYFLQACLLGILHHQRPGFLSYPASHLVPYLRTLRFPKEKYPNAYEYRAVEPRLLSKIQRVYRRFPYINPYLHRACLQHDAARLSISAESIDAVITSPPYMNALDYGRDNRLRLWFLGVHNCHDYDRQNNTKQKFVYLMERFLSRLILALKNGAYCVLVIGDISSSHSVTSVASMVTDIAINKVGVFRCEEIIQDSIPDVRRARREGRRTKREWIIVLRKREIL